MSSLAPFFLGHVSDMLFYIFLPKKRFDLLSGHSAQGASCRRFVELEEKYFCGAEATLFVPEILQPYHWQAA